MTKLIEFPIELCGNVIFFKIETDVYGPLWFVLDTGAYISVIDKSVTDQIALETRPIYTSCIAETPCEGVVWANVGELKIPGVNLVDPWIEAKPLQHLEAYWGRRIDGLLGGDASIGTLSRLITTSGFFLYTIKIQMYSTVRSYLSKQIVNLCRYMRRVLPED